MNLQGILRNGKWVGGIEWTRLPGHKGFTSNPIRGCEHECRWRMPDGTVAICYAESTALKFHSAYPKGFSNLSFDEDELRAIERHKEPCGIFFGSMTDWMGRGVRDEWIAKSLTTMRQCPQHIFQTLTKNAPRLLKFDIPRNVWVGVSAPPTFMFGKELTPDQQRSMVIKQLGVLHLLLEKDPERVTWMSIEPLSFDIADVFTEWCQRSSQPLPLKWAVIGAASNGPKYFQPDPEHVESAHRVLRKHSVAIFHKGNLKWEPHLEEYPAAMQTLTQEALL